MKVVCKLNNLNDITCLHTLDTLKKYISYPDGDVGLEADKEYVVYGITLWDNIPWFYICLEDDDEYPKPMAVEFFEIIDERLSRCWNLSYNSHELTEPNTSFVFPEWSKDLLFYEKLVDGNAEAINIFNNYRKFMDDE